MAAHQTSLRSLWQRIKHLYAVSGSASITFTQPNESCVENGNHPQSLLENSDTASGSNRSSIDQPGSKAIESL